MNLERIEKEVEALQAVSESIARAILDDNQAFPIAEVVRLAEIPRKHYFGREVQLHVLNNIRNGSCPEDCGYCAQRKDAPEKIASYPTKPDEEILLEAKQAYESGAYRYCLVTSQTGPTDNFVERISRTIERIKEEYPMEVCLSAGILKNPGQAARLKKAGLDRYNHNINTSESFYDKICTTHDYADRMKTVQMLTDAGVSLCSGVIVGMGESNEDIVSMAATLQRYSVPSIPVNFFMPVPGHRIEHPESLYAERCLRILAVFRLMNPSAELRAAAGRELYLKDHLADTLRIANSIFVSGYLNVKGDPVRHTLAEIEALGYEAESGFEGSLEAAAEFAEQGEASAPRMQMKTEKDLRPFAQKG